MSGIADAARKIPGVAGAEGAVTGALATEEDLPIKDYDKQSAEDIASKLKGFSQRQLRTIDAYERKNENRATITDKVAKLTGEEPWSGYDELSAEAAAKAVGEGDEESAKKVRSYERNHKDRSSVIQAADRRIDAR
jgi:SpoVK/Ycf46/Vps4 family AAA+-type ATPase